MNASPINRTASQADRRAVRAALKVAASARLVAMLREQAAEWDRQATEFYTALRSGVVMNVCFGQQPGVLANVAAWRGVDRTAADALAVARQHMAEGRHIDAIGFCWKGQQFEFSPRRLAEILA